MKSHLSLKFMITGLIVFSFALVFSSPIFADTPTDPATMRPTDYPTTSTAGTTTTPPADPATMPAGSTAGSTTMPTSGFPSIEITSSVPLTQNLGGTVPIKAKLSGPLPEGYTVHLFVDTPPILESIFPQSEGPYELSWDTTQTPDGMHTIQAQVVAISNSAIESLATIPVMVENQKKVEIPSIEITSSVPLTQNLGGTVQIGAKLSGPLPEGHKVRLFISGSQDTADHSFVAGQEPFQFDWDTTKENDWMPLIIQAEITMMSGALIVAQATQGVMVSNQKQVGIPSIEITSSVPLTQNLSGTVPIGAKLSGPLPEGHQIRLIILGSQDTAEHSFLAGQEPFQFDWDTTKENDMTYFIQAEISTMSGAPTGSLASLNVMVKNQAEQPSGQ